MCPDHAQDTEHEVGYFAIGASQPQMVQKVGDPPAETVEHHFHEEARSISYSFDGPFGRTFTFTDPDGYAVTIHDKR